MGINPHLQSAIQELRNANAKGLPSAETVQTAANGKTWEGKIGNNGSWKLIKNREDSYTNNTQIRD
ncbi:MAG: hypothetical protein Q8P27_00185 [Candidatus Peregrinibacteria bacterium]|nr:hypothetical protein [Candidatus Peregrinibacteria bacterium]